MSKAWGQLRFSDLGTKFKRELCLKAEMNGHV